MLNKYEITRDTILNFQDKYITKSVKAWNKKVFIEGRGAFVVDIEMGFMAAVV